MDGFPPPPPHAPVEGLDSPPGRLSSRVEEMLSPSAAMGKDDQVKLLTEMQVVFRELREDIVRLQDENRDLQADIGDKASRTRVKELERTIEEQATRHKQILKEARFKLVRSQQEKQTLKNRVSELEIELSGRPSTLIMEEEASGKITLLEAANDELRRENAALREQKLAFMTSELSRLHPSDTDKPEETDADKLNAALSSTVTELATARHKVTDLESRLESQVDLNNRKTKEYESLLISRKAEHETMTILSNSLCDMKDQFESSQNEIVRLQEQVRELESQAAYNKINTGGTSDQELKSTGDSASATTIEELREELSVVKQTASGAISTLSTSLKKALLQSQELCSDFEKDRLEMKGANENAQETIRELEATVERLEKELSASKSELAEKEDELQARADTLKQQQIRATEAKQRLKQDILGTRQLIRSQQVVLGEPGTPETPTTEN